MRLGLKTNGVRVRNSQGADGEGGTGVGAAAFPHSQVGEERWVEVKHSHSCSFLLYKFCLLLKNQIKASVIAWS